jgi:PAS domain S-box-containing protein
MTFEVEGMPCMLTISQDVTEAVEERRRSGQLTERLAAMFRASPVPLVVAALGDGRLLEVNEIWLQLEGRTREEAIGRTSAELGLWTDPAEQARLRDLVRRDGRVRGFVSRFRRATGEEIDCVISADPIDWDGVPALLVSTHDISDLEQARREAQAARDRFEALFHLSPVPIVVGAVRDGAYLATNDAWLALHGYRREELEGHSSLSLGVWAEPSERARLVGMLQRGEAVRGVPVGFRRKDGTLIESL